jgi:hypothetical protein
VHVPVVGAPQAEALWGLHTLDGWVYRPLLRSLTA